MAGVSLVAIIVALVGCGDTPATDAGSNDASTTDDAFTRDGGADDGGHAEVDAGEGDHDGGTEDDAATEGDASADAATPGIEATWGRRACSVTIRYSPRSSGSTVQLAGDFTGWGDAPIAMPDDDGDGEHSVTVGPERGIEPGTTHPYRIIVDREYLLDPLASRRKYDGACINSAFLAPDCTGGPELVATDSLTTTFESATRTGHARVHVAVHTATDRAAPREVRFLLDGTPVTATLDVATGTYAVDVAGVAEGRHVLAARATDVRGRDAAPLDMPFWIEETAFDWRDATMYMTVVDRFANGQTSSDAPIGSPVERPADFHGGDLVGLARVIESGYFENLGVNAIWISPTNQQVVGHFPGRDDGRRYAGYHGYWPTRGQTVEPRFGGNEGLSELVDTAHAHGIRVLLDLINNQVHEQHEQYIAHPEWFRTGCVCGIDSGCGWSERPLDCLFAPYLPDINWRVPEAEAHFLGDAMHWIEEYGVDGFRIDAVKHVETNSIYDLRAAVAERYETAGYRHYFVGETAVGQWDSVDYGCGERFTDGYAWLDAYTGERALDGQFDFPTHHRLGGLVDGTMGYDAVQSVIDDATARLSPEGLHVRFLGTHDSGRIASRAAMDPATGCTWPGGGSCSSMPGVATDPAVYARLRRAFAVLYTLPGIPFLYYGDELAMPGGNDPDNRRDMVFDGPLASLAMSGSSLRTEQTDLRTFVAALGRARQASVAWRRGRRVPLLVSADLYVVAWVGDRPGEVAIMIANRGGDVTNRGIDGLNATQLEGIATLSRAAGLGAVRRTGTSTRIFIDMPAGETGVFLP